jgi:hypothetical protein
MDSAETPNVVIAAMQQWLERAVIGLNLCPFAKSVYVKKQIHYVVCASGSPQDVLDLLESELLDLKSADPQQRDTTLLMAPQLHPDFLDFNDFLAAADALLKRLKLNRDFQIASFHPHFQFAGTGPEDIGNYTNRAPYPTLHLLREDSLDRAVQAFPEAEAIYEKNMETLERMGHVGWSALGLHTPPNPQEDLTL